MLGLIQDCDVDALRAIAAIMRDSDVSPFEIIHSGIVGNLLTHLTSLDVAASSDVVATGAGPKDDVTTTQRDNRVRNFLHVFLNCPVSLCGSLQVNR